MKEVFLDFIAHLNLTGKDPYFEKWSDTFETVRYHSKKVLSSASTVVSETLSNVTVPSCLPHAERIIARKHENSKARQEQLHEISIAGMGDNPSQEQQAQAVSKEIGVKELAQLAATFEIVHCS